MVVEVLLVKVVVVSKVAAVVLMNVVISFLIDGLLLFVIVQLVWISVSYQQNSMMSPSRGQAI